MGALTQLTHQNDALFAELRRSPGDPPRAVRDELERVIVRLVERLDPVPRPVPG